MGVLTLRELGERLRQAREEKGISLEQIKNSTKIRLCYLQALENGELRLIPGEVYIRGFLQNYAACVGLNSGEILEQYDQLRAAKDVPVPKAAELEAATPEPRPRFNWWQPALVGGAIVLLASLIYLGRSGESRPAPPIKRQESPVAPAVNTPEPPREKGLHLVLNYTARCWVSVVCDGDTVFKDTVDAGKIQEWEAKESINCRFGNAGGVQATLNGKALGPMGITGQNAVKEFRAPEAP